MPLVFQYANVMVGNPVICLDIDEKSNFHHLTTIEADLVIIALDLIKTNLDLTSFKSIKYIYLIGHSDFKVTASPQVQFYRFSGK